MSRYPESVIRMLQGAAMGLKEDTEILHRWRGYSEKGFREVVRLKHIRQDLTWWGWEREGFVGGDDC